MAQIAPRGLQPRATVPHVMTVFGTRPEAIKMLPVVRAVREQGMRHTLLCTGQHRDLAAQVFAAFGERPDIDLDLMRPGQTPNSVLAAILTHLPPHLEALAPDIVLVHGDTTTALGAALAAFHAGIPVGHVEAGLRSYDLSGPFPEEMNRVAVDALAALRFAPNEESAANLAREYSAGQRCIVTGNTGIDALLHVASTLPPPAPTNRPLILVTAHRRESLGQGFANIAEGLARIAARGDAELVLPLHPNPAVREALIARLAGLPNIRLTEPLDYPAMVALLRQAHHVITDSGGLQEEAPALGKPVLILREVTERPEAVAAGVARIVGTDPERIAAESSLLLDDPAEYAARARPVFPYGDGQAARRIAAAVAEYLS
ncbi:MAG: UDP-N-acetylglucosamine 2-epimerase (non-hydrolyzing) [Rhodovarius sp.]|nr:UDP-N-acetylglucosamine 2-epimerase (non-hydrolyzing) [Rhodovarius sp.]MCX7933129.1 UDP-N-acetylglucosamine 2-epimerase (non-hydrolyzing) [Rhodovarius sp.]MDW8315907.1 UDP-N-acetylglucosamine 2-epimerase (non-hydrolyzing) [Rhodovarius sp.]